MLMLPTDLVNHPPHYGGGENKYEAIKVIDAWELSFCLGNVVKYICRADSKGNKLEDLKKARWYLDHEIERTIGGSDVHCQAESDDVSIHNDFCPRGRKTPTKSGG